MERISNHAAVNKTLLKNHSERIVADNGWIPKLHLLKVTCKIRPSLITNIEVMLQSHQIQYNTSEKLLAKHQYD